MTQKDLPDFMMLVGIPGSGKTRWLNNNVKAGILDHNVVRPDDIRKKFSDGVYNRDDNEEVCRIAKQTVIDCIKNGDDVILDATNVSTHFRTQFMEGLPACNKLAMLFVTAPSIACRRVQNDIKNNIDRAPVPDETIYRMYGEFIYTQTVIKSEGFIVSEIPSF